MFRLIIFGFSLLISIIAWPDQDKIPPLPLINFTVNFQQYSGYLQASATKRFHYWFTFSQRDYTRDPVILWLNGGPGCSSLEGLLEELGPFKIGDKASVVYANPYSWNKFASVVFIESPAGVGFSYSTDQNVTTDDDEVAQNNYDALIDFFNKFPDFRDRDFYITGESYAGVYLPMVGAKIVKDKQNFPNFKGMAIGNGALNWPNNYGTMVPLYYYHALVRQELWDTIAGKCCNNDMVNCPVFTLFKTNPGCRTMLIELLDGTDELDPYNLYSSCYLDGSTNSKRNHIERHYRKMIDRPLRSIKKRPGVPLCAQDTNTETYLARRDVRQALHIPGLLPDWQECSDPVEQAYGTTHFDMTPEFLAVSDSGARVLVYNGDVDTVCNHVMNQNFLTNLNKTILGNETVNAAWYYAMETPNVAGFVTLYSGGIDYVTIRGSGHFVPEDKPKESLQMIYNWINKLDYSIPVPQF
ncbi:unnamed protein product, partial [Mesorhabditis belari]|uniref:Carboxypeptidase n=1 Tax=Mesorhabditis belari TaxID=2138241 RepID=A0AAF3F4V6_9BILA